MKKRGIKLFLIVIAGGVVLATVAILLWPRRPFWLTSFRFLDGRKPSLHKGYCVRYDFKGDFNDVCAEADAELMALGRWECIVNDSFLRLYRLRRGSNTDCVIIARLKTDPGRIYIRIATVGEGPWGIPSGGFSLGEWLGRLIWRIGSLAERARQ